jgi:hypothetical protein
VSNPERMFVVPPSDHAELSASSAERWMTCAGSVALSRGVPRVGSKFAAEGTAAHALAAYCLAEGEKPQDYLGKTALVEDYEIVFDEELVAAVEEYVHYIVSTERAGDEGTMEQSFTEALKRLHPKFGGSTDYVRYRASEGLLEIVDYKHGAGVPVDVDDNKQLKYYALGALMSNPQWGAETVKITIVQPRCDHEQGRIRSYTFPAVDLVDYAADLVAAAKATEEFGADLKPSKKACRFCPANAANKCPAIEKATQEIVAASFNMLEPEKYSLGQIAEFLQKAPLVEARISALREFAYQRACAGETIPGFKLVDKRATRKWKDEEDAKEHFAKVPGAMTEPELRSPAQLEKLLGKKKFAQYNDLIEKQSSGHTLVPDTDNRPSVATAQLEDFGVVEE